MQVKSIQMFAAGAPVLLVGTRRGEVSGGDAELQQMSDRMLAELKKACAPAVEGLVMNQLNGSRLCFFGIENQKGYQGDETIRELVKAIEAAAHTLPSMKRKVPLPWLLVYDELRKMVRGASPTQ